MNLFEKFVRPTVPIQSFTSPPRPVPVAVDEPEVGRRWGKPSKFNYSFEKSRSRGGGSGTESKPPKKYDDVEIVNFEGRADDYIVNSNEDLPMGVQVRRTNQFTYTGRQKFFRTRVDPLGKETIYQDGFFNIKIILQLKLHDDDA